MIGMIKKIKMYYLIFFLTAILFQAFPVVSHDKESLLMDHVKTSIKLADGQVSKLIPEVLAIDGMSSHKVRHLLNNLCSLPGANYLEIGCWKGSTWVSALFGNDESITNAIAIDNWSEFGGPQREFLENCKSYLSKNKKQYYSADAFKININKLSQDPINVYFYDGHHSTLSQELALTYYDKILDDVFIFVVDDWNWDPVRAGTFEALRKLDYEILYSAELPARFNGDREQWWNGIYIAVLRKN